MSDFHTSSTVIAGGDSGAFPDGFLALGAPAALLPTGSTQADAAAVTAKLTSVSSVDGTKGVILPAISAPGAILAIYNATATNGLKVYPASGGTINGDSANANISLEGKTLALLIAMDSTNWAAIYTVNA